MKNNPARATEEVTRTGEDVVDLYVYRGETHGRVIAEHEASPTGYTSMTGAFATGEKAIEALVRHVSTGTWSWHDTTVRFHDLDTGELLREITVDAAGGR